MEISKHMINELMDKEYRDSFVSAHIENGIPFQIRALRKQRGWTQKELAERLGMKQERISALENPNYSKFTLTTLKKLASAFDVALIVRFAPFGELVRWQLDLSPEKLEPVSFDKDPYFKPPIYTHIAQRGIVVGGEGVAKFINPSQQAILSIPLKTESIDELSNRREAKEKDKQIRIELERKLQGFMAMGGQNAIALG